MTVYIVAAFAVLLLASAVLYLLWQGASKSLKASRESETRLRAEIEHRDSVILTLQEAHREQEKRTEKISSGTDGERVASSIDVLHDIAEAGRARAGKN